MKRLLLSIGIGLLAVTVYSVVSSVIFVLSGDNIKLLPYLDLPLRLPKIMYYYFYPPTAEDYSANFTQRKLFLVLFAYIANALLYSIPAYILSTVISRRRRKDKLMQAEPPPPPPFVG